VNYFRHKLYFQNHIPKQNSKYNFKESEKKNIRRASRGYIQRRFGFAPESGQVGFVVDKVALGQVFSEYFGFPCQSSFHQILPHHNHPGQVQQAIQWPTCRVDPFGLHPPLCKLKKKGCIHISNFTRTERIPTLRTHKPGMYTCRIIHKLL
jgi:hypothetical protein